jgi:hypothetical protein
VVEIFFLSVRARTSKLISASPFFTGTENASPGGSVSSLCPCRKPATFVKLAYLS